MAEKSSHPLIASFRTHLVTGLLTIIPLAVTVLAVRFLWNLLAGIGQPAVTWLEQALRPHNATLADWLTKPWFQSILSVILIIVVLVVLGWATRRVVGRKLLDLFDAMINRIPLVTSIYNAVKSLLSALQKRPDDVQRVVLIDFPSPEMKTVGLVTRTLKDVDTGKELAAVYVPTTPNPTSGYLEIVPVDKITSTTWTVEEAMTFIVSGGAVAPDTMNYDKSHKPTNQPPLKDMTEDDKDAEG